MVSVVLRSATKPYTDGLLTLSVCDTHLRDHSSSKKKRKRKMGAREIATKPDKLS